MARFTFARFFKMAARLLVLFVLVVSNSSADSRYVLLGAIMEWCNETARLK